MNIYEIAFPYDNEDGTKKKVKFIKDLVGEDNISLSTRINVIESESYGSIVIRCTEEQWNEIKFQLDLTQIWA